MSIFDLVLTGLGEISENIPDNNDLYVENADFGHFGPFLACFWPVITPEQYQKLSMSTFVLILT